jgi:putative ABC transport system permease protein
MLFGEVVAVGGYGLRAPLWWLSATRRPVSAISILLVVVLATAAAASGPMLLRAVDAAALRQALIEASRGSADIVISGQTSSAIGVDQIDGYLRAALRPAHASGLFGPAVATFETSNASTIRPAGVSNSQPGIARVRLAARSDACAAFPIVAGRCPTGSDEVVIPSSLDARRIGVGQRLSINVAQGRGGTLRVVGRYDARRSTALLLADTAPVVGEISAPDLVMSTMAISGRDWALTVTRGVSPLAGKMTVDREGQARNAVDGVQRQVVAEAADLSFSSALPDLLDRIDRDRQATAGLILVVTAEVVALAWFGAVVVMRLAARVRGREWALGRLRGLRGAWLTAVYGEMAVLLAVGAVLGMGLAVVTCRLAVRRYLPATASIEPVRLPVLVGAGLALVGLAAGLVISSLRTARAPLASLLRESAEPPQSSRTALVVEALVVALAAASVYQLTVGNTLTGQTAGLALLAPGLVAIAVGLLGIRLVAALVRRRTVRPARSVAGLVIWRQLTRVPSILQRNVALALAVALAVFATQLGALSLRNRTARADAIVGAATVAHVRVPAGHTLLDLVRKADPSGKAAMAVTERDAPSDGDISRVVAVDTTRLGTAAWQPSGSGLTVAQVARLLRPRGSAPTVVRGTQLLLRLADVQVTVSPQPTPSPSDRPAPQLNAIVAGANGWQTLPLGVLSTGASKVHSAPMQCRSGCRLVKFTARATTTSTYVAKFTVTSLATDTESASDFDAALHQTGRWQAVVSSLTDPQSVAVDLSANGRGLAVRMVDRLGSATPAFAPRDLPDPLPALLGAATATSPVPGQPHVVAGTGFDDQRQMLTVVGRVPILPRALNHGVLVDLAGMSSLSDPAASHADSEVWLSPGDHPDVMGALAKSGVVVIRTESLGSTLAALARVGTARAVLIDLALAWLGGLLALAFYVSTQVIDGPRRRRLWEVTRHSGVTRPRMARLVMAEFTIPALLGVLVGALAGVLAVLVAGHRLPLFPSGTVGPPLQTQPSWRGLAVIVAIAVVVVVAAGALTAAAEAAADRRRL